LKPLGRTAAWDVPWTARVTAPAVRTTAQVAAAAASFLLMGMTLMGMTTLLGMVGAAKA
jgi:hypothetical protein